MRTTLLADIGGTNARFALLSGDRLGSLTTLAVAAHASFDHAMRFFIEHHAAEVRPDAAILAAAGPVERGRCQLTNSSWVIDATDLQHRHGLGVVDVINDHEAIAWSLPELGPADTLLIGSDTPVRGAPLAVLGAGTGLGAAAFLPGPGARSVASEGGHTALAATNEREDKLIAILRRRFGHVSAERALSGPGLVNLYQAIAELDGQRVPQRRADQITRGALYGTCAVSGEAIDQFCAFLGSVAGDTALHFAARGGLYLAGGIVPRFPDRLALSNFRQRFDDKGRMRGYLATIPVRIILRSNPALLGLKAFATWRFGSVS